MKTGTSEVLLKLAQVRERLQCSRSSVWRAINDRGLPVVRVGGLVRVRERDLEAWVAKYTKHSGETTT